MRSGHSKVVNDRVMQAALKDNWRSYKKGGNGVTRFFFITKFESTCNLCQGRVQIGVKAMIRPATKELPKLFCCHDCSAPWRGEETPESTKRAQRDSEQYKQDVENRVHLDTSGERDEIYKILDQIYEQ